MNTTTRRHPRTASDAFRGCDYGCAIERPRESRWSVLAGCIFLGVMFAAMLVFGWSS